MANRITIDGNFRPFIRGIRNISNSLNNLSKKKHKINIDDSVLRRIRSSKISIFDKKSAIGFRDFNVDTYNKLKEKSKDYKKQLSEIRKIEKQAGELNLKIADHVLQKKEKILNLERDTSREIRRQLTSFRKGNRLQRAGAKMQINARSGRGGSDVMGGILTNLGSASKLIGPAGWVAGAGIAGYIGARALTSRRRGLADVNLQMMGLRRRGATSGQLESMANAGVEYGFTGMESMQAATQLQRRVGNIRSRNAIEQLSRMRRMTGFGADELTGLAGTFRRAATTRGEAGLEQNLKKTMNLYREAMVSALDTSGAIQYMQTTAEMTDRIANEGTADIQAVRQSLSTLMLGSEFYGANAQRASKVLGGLEDFYKSERGTGIAARAMRLADVEVDSFSGLYRQQQLGFFEGEGRAQEKMGGISGVRNTIAAILQSIGKGEREYREASPEEKRKIMADATMMFKKMVGEDLKYTNVEELMKMFFTGGLRPGREGRVKELMKTEEEIQKEKEMSISTSLDQGIKNLNSNLDKFLRNVATTGDMLTHMTNIEGAVLRIANKIVDGNVESPKSPKQIVDEEIDKTMMTERERGIKKGILTGPAALGGENLTDMNYARKRSSLRGSDIYNKFMGNRPSQFNMSMADLSPKEFQDINKQQSEDLFTYITSKTPKKSMPEATEYMRDQRDKIKDIIDERKQQYKERGMTTEQISQRLEDEKSLAERLDSVLKKFEERMEKHPMGKFDRRW